MIDQKYFLDILIRYWPYIFFVLGAVIIAVIFYFFIGSLVEMMYDALVRHDVSNADVYGIFLNASIALLYLYTIYCFGQYTMQRFGINDMVVLFFSLAWCLSIIGINERFTSTEKFKMVIMLACLFGFLIWWFLGWLEALYMWAAVTFFFYVRAKNA